jgi:hypothetical protein
MPILESIVNKQRRLQEEQYQFPYHYIPEIQDEKVTLVKYWGWSIQKDN